MSMMNATPMTPQPRRKRLRVSLAAMMFAVLIVGGGLGWIARRARVQREAVAAILNVGGSVTYDWESNDSKPRGPRWLRRMIGPDYFDTVVFVSADTIQADDVLMVQIGRLTDVRALYLQGVSVTDAGLAHLANLRDLRTMHLRSSRITGSGLRSLVDLPKFHNLLIYATPITDGNLAHVERLSKLTNLGLKKTHISDDGIQHLARMGSLRKLWLWDSQIGDDGLRRLERLDQPMTVFVGRSRVTPAGIEEMKTRAPNMNIIP